MTSPGRPAHVPVLLERCVGLLAPALTDDDAVVVDCTLGMGGHAEALLEATPARLVGIDRDFEAIRRSTARLSSYADRTTFVHAVYDQLPTVLSDLGLLRVQGILFDLGVSSLQLDETDRGFAYSHDAPLDMRMDASSGHTAADIVNTYDGKELARVLREYGDERFASRIADAIVRERGREPFTSTARLAELVRASIPAATRRTGGHPAKRTFQALRIEVNDELGVLRRAIPAAIDALAVGGRLVVMSYQSLEDRIVKAELVRRSTRDVPIDLPFLPEGSQPELQLIVRGAEKASAAEVEANPRAASVRLRAAERLRAAA
ncbi:MAG: rRNA (cytosine1402-N4)-methyltransferase [Actinomycetota bacterium]|jgi:16S rRNA (cytosine1402-N4)-methyltransferase|nr:rRNA (cytosine1402-N4)-methyltransferase [Actinomycetota bacterium]